MNPGMTGIKQSYHDLLVWQKAMSLVTDNRQPITDNSQLKTHNRRYVHVTGAGTDICTQDGDGTTAGDGAGTSDPSWPSSIRTSSSTLTRWGDRDASMLPATCRTPAGTPPA
jgi:hypothetical protein